MGGAAKVRKNQNSEAILTAGKTLAIQVQALVNESQLASLLGEPVSIVSVDLSGDEPKATINRKRGSSGSNSGGVRRRGVSYKATLTVDGKLEAEATGSRRDIAKAFFPLTPAGFQERNATSFEKWPESLAERIGKQFADGQFSMEEVEAEAEAPAETAQSGGSRRNR